MYAPYKTDTIRKLHDCSTIENFANMTMADMLGKLTNAKKVGKSSSQAGKSPSQSEMSPLQSGMSPSQSGMSPNAEFNPLVSNIPETKDKDESGKFGLGALLGALDASSKEKKLKADALAREAQVAKDAAALKILAKQQTALESSNKNLEIINKSASDVAADVAAKQKTIDDLNTQAQILATKQLQLQLQVAEQKSKEDAQAAEALDKLDQERKSAEQNSILAQKMVKDKTKSTKKKKKKMNSKRVNSNSYNSNGMNMNSNGMYMNGICPRNINISNVVLLFTIIITAMITYIYASSIHRI